jgi:blue copper oxidase
LVITDCRELAARVYRSTRLWWRTFVLDPMMGMMGMNMPGMRAMGGTGIDRSSQMMGINGRSFGMDRVDVTAKLGTSEIWEIASAAMAHPFHIHGASFRILSNNGRKPRAEQSGWKDVLLVEDQRVRPFRNPLHQNAVHATAHPEHEDLG